MIDGNDTEPNSITLPASVNAKMYDAVFLTGVSGKYTAAAEPPPEATTSQFVPSYVADDTPPAIRRISALSEGRNANWPVAYCFDATHGNAKYFASAKPVCGPSP